MTPKEHIENESLYWKRQTKKERAEESLRYTKSLEFQMFMLGTELRHLGRVCAKELGLFRFLDWLCLVKK